MAALFWPLATLVLNSLLWLTFFYKFPGSAAFGDNVLPDPQKIGSVDGINSLLQQHQQPTCWIFTHLQKSGGSSIKKILKHGCSHCRPRIYDHTQWYHSGQLPFDFTSGLGKNDSCNIIMGGYTEALRLQSPDTNSCLWFTMFRHPISRLISAFFYCKKSPKDVCCGTHHMPEEAHFDIGAFAKHWGNYAVRQFAMGYIVVEDVLHYMRTTRGSEFSEGDMAGWYSLKLYLEDKAKEAFDNRAADDVPFNMIKPIKDLLSTHFTAVGILEEFNTTISLFDVALQIPGLSWRSEFSRSGIKNANHQFEGEEEKLLAEIWTNSDVRKYLHLDLLLYEHAVDVFRQQARFHGII